MRTVSFSSAPVHDSLTNDFVCYSLNIDGDPSAGASVGHAPTDSPGFCTRGIGKQNVQCLFLTPDGRIFHAASGFQGPEDLKAQLDTALKLFADIQEHPDRDGQIVRDYHQKRLDELQAESNAGSTLPGSFGQFMSQLSRGGVPGGGFNPTSFANAMNCGMPNPDYSDNQYMVEHPLIRLDQFERNPRELVGYERSAFVSVGNGGASGGQIGQ